jgi:hypothetical protein
VTDKEKREELQAKEDDIELHAAAAENWLVDFFAFKLFITKPFIRIIYVIGVLGLIFSSFYAMFSVDQVLWGIMLLVLGNIMWRIVCEVEMVVFHIHDLVKSLENELREE